MDNADFLLTAFVIFAIGFFGFTIGHILAPNDATIAPHMYQTIIKPALQDCTHPDYYYQDSHRELCDGLGVNATK